MSVLIGGYMTNKRKIKNKLVSAAIECIEDFGLQNTTSRKIAKKAGANLAAINYHFNSKDNLIEIALDQTLDEAFENMIDEELLNKQYPTFALYSFLLEFLQVGLKHPEIIKAHLFQPMMENRYDTMFMKKWNKFVITFIEHVSNMLPNMTSEEIELGIIHSLSNITFLGLLPGLYKNSTSLDISDTKTQQRFVKDLVSKNFHK